MDIRRWRNIVTVLLGVWILVSPLVLGFAHGYRDVMWNSWLIGVIVLIVSAGRAVAEVPMFWQEAVDLALGLWLIMSPWILGFAAHVPARICTVAAGILLAGIALLTIGSDIDVRKWMQEHKWIHG
jgi:hypothetical protein